MNSEPDLEWSDYNSIPKILNNYINARKKINNSEDLFIKKDFNFSLEDFLVDDYFLCEIILLLTTISKKEQYYMMKISEMNSDIQEFWADSISKYIEMRVIVDGDKSKIYDNQGLEGSISRQTSLRVFKHLSKDKLRKISSKKEIENSLSINDYNSKYQITTRNNRELLINNEFSQSNNKIVNFEEQKKLILTLKKLYRC